MLLPDPIRGVLFDYGNTLIGFGAPQIAVCDGTLAEELTRQYGPHDPDALTAQRDRDRVALYQGDPPEFRENEIPVITANLVRVLYGLDPTPEAVAALVKARFEAFVGVCEAAPTVKPFLDRLHGKYRLGLVSNYPDGEAIRESLRKVGLFDCFDSIVVSGDVGRAKPHPLPFQTALRELALDPKEALFVGDNWLADIQGAKRMGMWAAYTTEWTPYDREHFNPKPDDMAADLTFGNLAELERILLNGTVH